MPLERDRKPPNLTNKVNWTIKDVVFIFVAEYMLIFILSLLFLKKMKENPYIGSFFVNIFIIILTAVLLSRRKESWSSLGFVRKDNGKLIVKGICVGIILFFLTGLIFNCPFYKELSVYKFYLSKIFQTFFLLITFKGAVGILLTPFIEEMLFRGLFYQALLNKFNTWISMIIVSFLFTILHWSILREFNFFLMGLIFSFCLTYLFDRYKNLLISIACHMTLNYLSWALFIYKKI